jgi:hypothetical protein
MNKEQIKRAITVATNEQRIEKKNYLFKKEE